MTLQLESDECTMKYYGFKTTRYGNAYPPGDIDRKRQFYDALVRAGRKHARQQGKKEAKDGY